MEGALPQKYKSDDGLCTEGFDPWELRGEGEVHGVCYHAS